MAGFRHRDRLAERGSVPSVDPHRQGQMKDHPRLQRNDGLADHAQNASILRCSMWCRTEASRARYSSREKNSSLSTIDSLVSTNACAPGMPVRCTCRARSEPAISGECAPAFASRGLNVSEWSAIPASISLRVSPRISSPWTPHTREPVAMVFQSGPLDAPSSLAGESNSRRGVPVRGRAALDPGGADRMAAHPRVRHMPRGSVAQRRWNFLRTCCLMWRFHRFPAAGADLPVAASPRPRCVNR